MIHLRSMPQTYGKNDPRTMRSAYGASRCDAVIFHELGHRVPNPVLEITVLKLQEGQEIMTNNNCTGKYYLPKEVTFSLCFVCLFVCLQD